MCFDCFEHFDFETCFAPHLNSQLPTVLWTWCALYMLTSTCTSRHNGAHFFNISTSKSGSIVRCFVHFDFEICLAPQWHATFQLSSRQMALHPPLLRTYFSTLQSHKSMESKQWSATFLPFRTVHRDFSAFSRTCIFFLLTLSLLWSFLFFSSPLWLFPPLLFHLFMLSEVWLRNFRWQLELQLQVQFHHAKTTTTAAPWTTTTPTTTTTTSSTATATATATSTTVTATLQLQLQLEVQLHFTALRRTSPHYIQQLWLRAPPQPLQQTQLQPTFGPSVDSLCHLCLTTTHLSYSFLSLKLPPPPCAVLLDMCALVFYVCLKLVIYFLYILCSK